MRGPNAAYPGIEQDYRHTYEVLKALPCDIFLGAHASYYDGMAKAVQQRTNPGGLNPFLDHNGYVEFVRQSQQQFLARLAHEDR